MSTTELKNDVVVTSPDEAVRSAEQVESADVFLKLLKEGKYKRLVMENDEEWLDSKEAIDAMFADVRIHMSSHDSYDYFTRRHIKK